MKEANKKFHPANVDVMLEGMKRNHHLCYGGEKHQVATNDYNICFISTVEKQSFSKKDRLMFLLPSPSGAIDRE